MHHNGKKPNETLGYKIKNRFKEAYFNPATGFYTKSKKGSEIEVIQEPVKAWKQVQLTTIMPITYAYTPPEDKRMYFMAYGSKHYGQTAIAQCFAQKYHDQPIPYEKCTCGFYGYNYNIIPKKVDQNYHMSLYSIWLEVEFYGKVLCYDHIYRAEKQRVMAAYGLKSVLYRCCNGSCLKAAKYHHKEALLCSQHAIESNLRYYPIEHQAPDLGGIEWHWIGE